MPLHITQRGVDRCPTFLEDLDFAVYRWALREASIDAGCAVHAYVLMTNHVHLLVTPVDAHSPACMMRALGARYVGYFNARYRRTGTLWEGRFRSAIVDTVPYLFACSRYIELNPSRAGMVGSPHEYEWSSFRHNALGAEDPLVTAHPRYLALADAADERRAAYRDLFARDAPAREIAAIRALQRGRSKLSVSAYQEAVAALAGHSVAVAPAADGVESRPLIDRSRDRVSA